MLYTNHSNSRAPYFYEQSPNSSSSQSQHEQLQSSCSECKRNAYQIREQEQEDESSHVQRRHRNMDCSSQIDQQIEVPLRKTINEKNYQFEEMLRLLQYEVETLKKQNQTKDEIIKQLKFHVQKSIIEEQRRKQSDKQSFQINRLRQQLGCSPRNQGMGLISKGFRSVSSNKRPFNNHMRQNYELRGYDSVNTHNHNSNNEAAYNNMLHSFNPRLYNTNNHQLPSYNNLAITASPFVQQLQLKVALLQKQLRQYQLEKIQQKETITKLQQENKWQRKFIVSFVKMCDQLSLNYGEKLKLNKLGEDLKKKTKISWNYMKGLVAYFIEAINSNSLSQSLHR